MKQGLILFAVIFAFVLFHDNVEAGELRFGVKGGFDVSYVQMSRSSMTDAIVGPVGGVVLDVIVSSYGGRGRRRFIGWGFEINAMYQLRGGEFNSGIVRSKYIGFPVIAKVIFADAVSIGIGGNYQRLIESTSSKVKKDNLEFIFAIGLQGKLAPSIYATFDFRFNFGVLNYSTNTTDSFKTRSAEFMAGFLFKAF